MLQHAPKEKAPPARGALLLLLLSDSRFNTDDARLRAALDYIAVTRRDIESLAKTKGVISPRQCFTLLDLVARLTEDYSLEQTICRVKLEDSQALR